MEYRMKPGTPAGKRRPRPKKARTPRVQVEISAGGVVYKRTRRGIRVSLMLDPFGRWTFAKGHVEPGESVEQAALRETTEEMSLRGLKVRQPLGIIDFWFREKYRPGSRGLLVHKFVHYFLMEAPPGEWGSPQKEEKIRKITWVPPLQAVKMSSYQDVKPILDKAMIALGIKKRLPAASAKAGPHASAPAPRKPHRRPRPRPSGVV